MKKALRERQTLRAGCM